jgi:hypothetical protein
VSLFPPDPVPRAERHRVPGRLLLCTVSRCRWCVRNEISVLRPASTTPIHSIATPTIYRCRPPFLARAGPMRLDTCILRNANTFFVYSRFLAAPLSSSRPLLHLRQLRVPVDNAPLATQHTKTSIRLQSSTPLELSISAFPPCTPGFSTRRLSERLPRHTHLARIHPNLSSNWQS